MASGYGAFGGVSQCYRFWQGFTECRADYKECLHRDKLKRRIAAKCVAADEASKPVAADDKAGHH